jgi:hypothetical protein
MEQICDRCGKGVPSVVRESEPRDLYSYTKDWCFGCVYEKGLAEAPSKINHQINTK